MFCKCFILHVTTVLGRGGKQQGAWGSAVSSSSGVWDEAPAAKSFGAFWVLQVSSPAVLLLDLEVMNRDL